MKIRELKKIIPFSTYTVHNSEGKLCVGSSLCSDLISLNIETKELKYALDTWREGRKSIKYEPLEIIWDRLEELINNGEIDYYLEGEDEIENPLPVFSFSNGTLIKTTTDEYGWPNITSDGTLMYDNTFFKTEIDAIEYGIKETKISIRFSKEKYERLKSEIESVEKDIQDNEGYLIKLNWMKNGGL
jgi:hypothetical protein